jgi:hypothetical protein
MSWFIVKVKLKKCLCLLWHFVLRVAGGIEEVVEGTFTYTINRIHVPSPYLAVADSALGMLVVYPIYVGDTFLIACSSPLAHKMF